MSVVASTPAQGQPSLVASRVRRLAEAAQRSVTLVSALALLCLSLVHVSAGPAENTIIPEASGGIAEDDVQDSKLAEGRQALSDLAPEKARSYLLKLAQTDAPLALDLARTAARSLHEKYVLAAEVVRVWSKSAPEAAWAWALEESSPFEGTDEKSLRAIVLEEVGRRDPEALLGMIGSALAPERRLSDYVVDQVTLAAVEELADRRRPDLIRSAIEAWTRLQTPPRIGARTYEAAAKSVENSHSSAAAWLQTLPASDHRNTALGAIAASWADVDAEAAMKWANSLSKDEGFEEARLRALERWMHRDANAATRWLAENEDEATVDLTLVDLITSTLLRTEPATSLKWAGLITNPELRVEPIEQVLSIWAYSKPDDAARYLQTCPLLNSAQKRRIQRNLEINEQSEVE